MVMKLWKWLNNPSTLFWLNILLAMINLFLFYVAHYLFSLLIAGFNLVGAWANLKTLDILAQIEQQKKDSPFQE